MSSTDPLTFSTIHFSYFKGDKRLEVRAPSTDKTYSIAYKQIGSGFLGKVLSRLISRRFVPIGSLNGKTVYVNINSVAKHLLLPKEMVKTLQAKDLHELMVSAALLRHKVEAQLPQIIGEEEPILTEAKRQEIQELVKEAFESSKIYEVGEEDTQIQFAKDPLTHICTLRILEEKGRGAEGVFYHCISGSNAFALKVGHARKFAQAEYTMLNKIHEKIGKDTVGIQKKPHTIEELNFFDNKKKKGLGMLGVLYDGDFKEIKDNLSTQEKEDIAEQLLTGMVTLHKHKIFHADIKPQNIFVKRTAEGGIEADLADFGAYVDPTLLSKGLPPFTTSYTRYEEANEFARLYDAAEKNREGDHTSLIQHGQKMDCFAIGIVLYESLMERRFNTLLETCQYEKKGGVLFFFPVNEENRGRQFQPSDSNGDAFNALHPPGNATPRQQALFDIIKPLLHPDPAQRGDAKSVLKKLSDFRKDNPI